MHIVPAEALIWIIMLEDRLLHQIRKIHISPIPHFFFAFFWIHESSPFFLCMVCFVY
jgi:hypothetical protein